MGFEKTRFINATHLTIEQTEWRRRTQPQPWCIFACRAARFKGEMKERKPIFYDSDRVRWRRTRRVMEITGVLLTLLLAYFFVTIAVSVELPAGLLPDTKPGYHAVKSKKKPLTREGRRRRVANIGQLPATYDPVRAAFFVSWDPNSLASLKKHYKDIDLLIPEQLHAVSADGALTIVDYERGQYTTKATPAEAISILKDDKLHQWRKWPRCLRILLRGRSSRGISPSMPSNRMRLESLLTSKKSPTPARRTSANSSPRWPRSCTPRA